MDSHSEGLQPMGSFVVYRQIATIINHKGNSGELQHNDDPFGSGEVMMI